MRVPECLEDTFWIYRCVGEHYVDLDGLDDCSIDDLDEMLIAHTAIEQARARAK